MAPKLVAEEGVLKGLAINLEEGEEWTIGRDPEQSKLILEDPSVSRKHLSIKKIDDNYQIANFSETNPIEINESTVTDEHSLKHGDQLKIGEGIYRFYSDSEPEIEDIEQKDDRKEKDTSEKEEAESDKVEAETETEKEEAESDKEEAEADKEKAESDKEEAEADKEEAEADKEEAESDKEEAESDKEKAESDKEEAEADKEEAGTDKEKAETDKEKAEANKEEAGTEEEEKIDTLFEEDEGNQDVLAEVDLDLSDTNPWMLKVVSGPNNGAQFSMERGTSYVIGKDPSSCDIVFNDVSVSREHARLTISNDNEVTIEDLDSRNGTLIENKTCEGKQTVNPNSLISTGTTSFVVFDKESERETVISPLLPSIVKLLQEEKEPAEEEGEKKGEEQPAGKAEEAEEGKEEAKTENFVSTRILVGILVGLFLVVGFGTISLFTPQRIATKEYNTEQELEKVLGPYPSIQYSFNPTSGRVLLLGHVLTEVDRDQIIYNLRTLPFVSTIDNNIIVDENIWQETNQILAKNPAWRGVAIHSPKPGQFVLTGYLQTRKQADSLNDYLSQNFPYLELLTQKVIVEENILNEVRVMLKEQGFNAVEPKVSNGEVILEGDIPFGERPVLDEIIAQVKNIQGVRDVKPFITEMPPQETLVNLTNQYQVTGSLEEGDGKISVVIGGQLLTEGDTLDGRLITKIDNTMILLEKGGVRYRIDYNR